MIGAIILLPIAPSWQLQGLVYFFLLFKNICTRLFIQTY